MCECFCDYDPPTVLSEKTVKARKPHDCSECGRKIAQGEIYRSIWGIWEDHPDRFCWCAHCNAGHQVVSAVTDCDCFCYGGLWENFRDTCETCCDFALWRIQIGVQRKWLVRRGPRKGQLMPLPKVQDLAI